MTPQEKYKTNVAIRERLQLGEDPVIRLSHALPMSPNHPALRSDQITGRWLSDDHKVHALRFGKRVALISQEMADRLVAEYAALDGPRRTAVIPAEENP